MKKSQKSCCPAQTVAAVVSWQNLLVLGMFKTVFKILKVF